MFQHARDELGILIHLGNFVEEYFEGHDTAGIILKTGQKGGASIRVLMADGEDEAPKYAC